MSGISHSPTEGFLDLKPVHVEVREENLTLFLVILSFVLLGLLITSWYQRRQRNIRFNKVFETEERINLALKNIRTEALPLREAASELSLAFRTYIELKLKFSAAEMTNLEVLSTLKAEYSGRQKNKLIEATARTLSLCEEATFGSGKSFDVEEAEELIFEAKNIIVHEELENQTVIDYSRAI